LWKCYFLAFTDLLPLRAAHALCRSGTLLWVVGEPPSGIHDSDATAPVKGPYVACGLPAQTSKFIADSKKTTLQMFRGEQTTSF